MTAGEAVVCIVLGYVAGWWWRGRVERWLTDRDERARDALLDIDRMFDDVALRN